MGDFARRLEWQFCPKISSALALLPFGAVITGADSEVLDFLVFAEL